MKCCLWFQIPDHSRCHR
ncbi:MAG: (2Fe-2S)-binding protein [Nitrospirales bacterium]